MNAMRTLLIALLMALATQAGASEKLNADEWVSLWCEETDGTYQPKSLKRYEFNELLIKKDLSKLIDHPNVYDDCQVIKNTFRLVCKRKSFEGSWNIDRFNGTALFFWSTESFQFFSCEVIDKPKF